MRDTWRLAVGTFLAVPVSPPRHLDRRIAGGAMLLAPVTTVPALLLWACLAVLIGHAWLSPAIGAVLAVAGPVLFSRAMHLDGLADTADGLSAGYDPDRCLAVMRRSDIGPSGVTAIVLVLLADVACLATLLPAPAGAVLAGTALVASRLAPALAGCGWPAARPEGLGHAVARSVRPASLAAAITAALCLTALATWLGHLAWYAAPLVLLVALAGAWFVTARAVRRLGGVTGDVIGAAIELSLALALVVAAVLHRA
ncbi:MAG: adenosylcobinamide-GDP ribazoletransferase [Intrasporangium sp.]|uniref:adenosylcobinamide-GDP ribazoletransferase n=1 Tax=Intrasporangium sp. TaxID=1925024 RepID=UPI002648B5B6|nr:adenosylcobinamide-GDP ribazoletransferase [Intrasporangium sp.]MDN5796607.1 adenosylcobinamide-GDP ribazoletransferase [Intrasporangium sp.]